MSKKKAIVLSISCLLLISGLLPFSIFPVAKANEDEDLIEGEHTKMFLREISTNSVPEISINSTWADPIPVIDGVLETSEWENASQALMYGVNVTGLLQVINTNETLYLAITIPSDVPENDAILQIYLTPIGKYLLDNEGYAIVLYPTGEEYGASISNYTCSTSVNDTSRIWEIQIPLFFVNFSEEFPKCNMFLDVGDGINDLTEPTCHWPAYNNGEKIFWGSIGFAGSPTQEGQGITYITYVKDFLKTMDKCYETLQELVDYTPFSGEKISFTIDASLPYSFAGNQYIILMGFFGMGGAFHELAHEFGFQSNPVSFCEAEVRVLSNILASQLESEFSTQMLVFYDPSSEDLNREYYLSALQEYENQGSPFEELDFNQYNVPILDGILYELFDTYGMDIFSRVTRPYQDLLENFKLTEPLFIENEEQIHKWIFHVSIGARNDLRELFNSRWNFPVAESYSTEFYRSIGDRHTQFYIETNRIINMDSFEINPEFNNITYQIVDGMEEGYGNLTINQWGLSENPTVLWDVYLDGFLTEEVFFQENATHSSIYCEIDENTSIITIDGVQFETTIPELSSGLMLLVLIAFTIAIVSFQRKSRIQSNETKYVDKS